MLKVRFKTFSNSMKFNLIQGEYFMASEVYQKKIIIINKKYEHIRDDKIRFDFSLNWNIIIIITNQSVHMKELKNL